MSAAPAFPSTQPDDLLLTLLDISLTGTILFWPVYAADGVTISDLAFQHLNPAAQQLLQLPQQPELTLCQHFPQAEEIGLVDFYRQVWQTGRAGHFQIPYPDNGPDHFVQLAARRSGNWLVVSLADSAAQYRSAAEKTLRASRARAQDAHAEAERQRQQLHDTFMQAPARICILAGPEHVFELVNPGYQQLVGARQLLGLPIREALPELANEALFGLLDKVYRSGGTYHTSEMTLPLAPDGGSQPAPEHYYNFVYRARHDGQGQVDGILVFGYDVTTQVLARRQLEISRQDMAIVNAQLSAANEEMLAVNEKLRTSNDELFRAQYELRQLARTLEARVLERTQALEQARQATEQQRTRLERIFMEAPAAICILSGPELVFELVNPSYQQLFPGRQLLGLPLLAALPELRDQPVWHTLQEVLRTGQTHEESAMLIPVAKHEGGPPQDFYFNYIQQARFDEHGQVDGILSFAFEITEQVLARQRADALQAELLAAAQRQAQEREAFYQVFEQTPAIIGIVREPAHRLAYFNPAYQAACAGRLRRGRTIAELLPEAVAHGFTALLDRVYQTGETYYGNEQYILQPRPNGQPPRAAYFDFTYQPYREDSTTVGISIFAYDVTERVRARQRHEAQQVQLQALFEQAPVAIAVLRAADYRIEVANPLIANIWGRQPAQVLGRPLFEALPEVRDQGFREILEQVVATGEAFVAQEVLVMLRRHGQLETIYLNFVYQPLRDAQGLLTSVAIVATEVSEQVANRQKIIANNRALDRANQQLTRTNTDLDSFIYTASHDLKAPISNIEGLLVALREELALPAAEADVPTLLTLMQGSVERFKRTIADLTEVTKLQKANQPPTSTVDLAALAEDVRLDLRPLFNSTGGQLRVAVAASPTLAFAEKNLRSVVYNLVSNALKYHHPDRPPVVELRAYPTADRTVLEVQDNGLGIAPSQQHKLFGMFQRLHDHVEGSGIGLYMVKKIVENAGGRIEVQSEPGVGSTFKIYFPR